MPRVPVHSREVDAPQSTGPTSRRPYETPVTTGGGRRRELEHATTRKKNLAVGGRAVSAEVFLGYRAKRREWTRGRRRTQTPK